MAAHNDFRRPAFSNLAKKNSPDFSNGLACQHKRHLQVDSVLDDDSVFDLDLHLLDPGALDLIHGFRGPANSDLDRVLETFWRLATDFDDFGN
jgi:hypothetical protein